jgi:hypothetical protein
VESALAPDVYTRVRSFLEGGHADGRRVTAEWLAGRLGVPVDSCELALDRLARERVVRRRGRGGGATWFDVASGVTGPRRLAVAVLAVAASGGVVVTGAMLEHVFYVAMGLALGIMIAFAWVDWELRARS